MADSTSPAEVVSGVIEGYLDDAFITPVVPFGNDSDIALTSTRKSKAYVMRGRDANCIPLTYREWVSLDTPDFAGAKYTGTFCGVSLSLTEVTVTRTIKGG